MALTWVAVLWVAVSGSSALPAHISQPNLALGGLKEGTQGELVKRTSTCPSGWNRYSSSCYAFGHFPLPWAAASQVCETFGAELARVETRAENNFLAEVARSRGYNGLWLGITDILNEGHFVRIGNGNLVRSGFTNWSPNEPNNVDNGEDCAHLVSSTLQWNDFPCTAREYFACKISLYE